MTTTNHPLVGCTIIDKGIVGQVLKGRILFVGADHLTVSWREGAVCTLPFSKVTAGAYDVVVPQ